MAFRYSPGIFKGFLDGSNLQTLLADGSIAFYTGSQPASAYAAVTGTLIARVTESGGAWVAGTATNGINFGTATATTTGANIDIDPAESWDFEAVAAGTIGWGRFVGNPTDAGGTSTTLPRIDFSVGITSGDMLMAKTTYAIGEQGTVQQFKIPLSNIS